MLAVDKVGGAFDVAFCVDLVSGLREEGILVAVEANAVVALLGVVGAEGAGLGAFSVGVFDVDVVEFCVGGAVLNCAC